MIYSEFITLMKNNQFNNTYLFTGEEDFLIDECIEKLKREYVQEGLEALNYSVFDGKNTTFDELFNSCETLPFMSPKKIVILKDLNLFVDNISEVDEFCDYIENLGSHLCLVLVDSTKDLKKTSKIYKYYSKNKLVVEFTKLKGKDLTSWVEKVAKKNKMKISLSNVNYFIQHSTYLSRNITSTLYDLENEWNKVVSYCKNGEIQKEDIEFVMIKSLDNNVFDLLGAISKADVDGSLSIFNNIYLANEPIQKILFMISRQIRLMLGYNIYRQKGYTDGEIIEKLQIKPYEYQKISSQAKVFSVKTLEGSLNLILEVDKKIKTTSIDEKIEMEILLVRLCKKI